MNYYLKKRLQQNIKRSDMANMLGLDYNFYQAIEKGSVKMPLNLIDKFNEIINRGKENDIIGVENKIKADEFWNEASQKDETGRYILIQKMHEFNIQNMQTLVNLLGYKSCGTVWNYLQGRNPVGDEFKKRLYNFFSDETNIQIPKGKPITNKTYQIKNEPRKANTKLDRYYEKTDFKKILKENNITNCQIADAIGVHNSTVSQMTCKKYKPSYRIMQLVKDYLDEHINQEEKAEEKANDYISKSKLISECEQEIQENTIKIEALQKQIAEISTKIELTAKFIDLIKALK